MSHGETERPPCARLSAGRALPAPTRVPSSAHALTEAIPVSAPRRVSARHSRVKERGLRSAEASQDADPGGRALASPCSLHALTVGAATASRRRSTHGAHRRAPGPLRPRHGFQGLAVRATLAWACPDSWPFLSVLLALLPRSCSPPGRLRVALLLIRPYSALAGRPGGVHSLVPLPPRVSSLPAPAVRGRAPPDLPPCAAPVCRQGHRGASLACPPGRSGVRARPRRASVPAPALALHGHRRPTPPTLSLPRAAGLRGAPPRTARHCVLGRSE